MLALVVGLALLASRDAAPRAQSYTNEDLDRIAPFRAETGGSSEPAVAPPAPDAARRKPPEKPGRESYWRAESRRVQDRMRALDDKAVALRQKIEDRRRDPKVLPYSDPQIRRWEEQAQELLTRSRQMETDLLDRARREGALPGWLR